MVEGAGVPQDLVNGILGPRGFAPILTVPSLSELATRMRLLPPALVIVPVGAAGQGGEFDQFALELRRSPSTGAVGTAPMKDTDTILAAMRSGVTEFLVTPPDPDELRAVIGRVLQLSSASPTRGQVYTVYSAKGGLGTSTLAASLAWELAQRNGRQGVSLTDLTTTGAGMRVMLNINPLYDLGNIAVRSERLDRELVRSVMLPHPEGPAVLVAAEEVEAAEALDATTTSRLFEVMKQEYAYTVVDADHHFSDPTLAALDAADRVLLVTQLDVSALRSTQRSIGILVKRLGFPNDKVVVIANRRSERDRISVTDAETVLGRKVDFRIPNDYASCSDAITRGQFVQQYARTSPIVTSVRTMATVLTGNTNGTGDTESRGEKSRLSRIFGRR